MKLYKSFRQTQKVIQYSVLLLPLAAVAEPIDKNTKKIPKDHEVWVITGEQQDAANAGLQPKVKADAFNIQRANYSVSDIIKRLPGVYMAGAPGEDKDVRLRGVDKEFTRMQLDGIQLPDGGEKREMNVDRIPSVLIDEITLIRNPGAEYEADGIAGRIKLKTKKIPKKRRFEADVATGDNNHLGTGNKQFSMYYGERLSDKFGIQSTFSFQDFVFNKQKDKFKGGSYSEENTFESKPTRNMTGIVEMANYYKSGHNEVKFIYMDTDEDKTKTLTKYKKNSTAAKEYENEWEDKQKVTKGISVGNHHRFTAATKVESSVGFYQTNEQKDKTKRKYNEKQVEDIKKNEREWEDKTDQFWQEDLKLTHRWDNHKFKTGLSLRQRERDRTKQLFKDGKPQQGEAKSDYLIDENYYAAFVQNETFFSERFSLLPGVRVEHVTRNARSGNSDAVSSKESDVLPSLSSRYMLTPDLWAYAGYSMVVNRPKFDELSPYAQEADDKYILGNPDLKSAKANAFDVGLEFNQEQISFGVNLFYRDVQDLIESRMTGQTIDGKPVQQVVNVGDGFIRGIELQQRLDLSIFDVSLLEPFSISANQSFFDSEVTDETGVTTPFKEQPNFVGNVTLAWDNKATGTSLAVSLNHSSRVEANSVNDGISAQNYVDATFTQAINKQLAVYLQGANITREDRTKTKVNGETEVEQSDRTVWLGLKGKF
ncbi:TonB-dependent receptor [Aeromonas veronii]|nr:TonB-dependent receptor [Aeromonas veronii]